LATKFTLSAFAIVLDWRNRILLAHRRDMDLWDLPGGGLEPDELPTEAAIRETKEETGLDVRVDRLFAVANTPDNRMAFAFYCHAIGGAMTTGEESDDVRFFSLDKLPENLSPRKRALIQLVKEHPREVIFRHIDLPKAQEYIAVYGDKPE